MSCGNPVTPQPDNEPVTRTVFCVKFQREMPGLDEPPFDGELGQKIFQNVSREAWKMWAEHCKMILNEYRLNPANKSDQEILVKQMEEYFFGERPRCRQDLCRRRQTVNQFIHQFFSTSV